MFYVGFIALFSCLIITRAIALPAQDVADKNYIRTYYQKLSEKNESASSTCDECKLIVRELKNVINDTAKLERVKFFLKEMCRIVGGSQEQECINMIDRLDVLIRALGPYIGSPEQFCIDIHLCNKPKIPFCSRTALHLLKFAVRSADAAKVNNLLCDECIFAATEINSMIRNPDVQQEIKMRLEQICHLFPRLKEKCDELVEKYFQLLVQFLENLMGNPQHFCTELKVCPGSNETVENEISRALTKNPNEKIAIHKLYLKKIAYKNKLVASMSHLESAQRRKIGNAACVLCKIGCESAALKLKSKKDIIGSKSGAFVCHMLPDELATNCLDFTRIYASSIVSMTVDEYVNDKICINAGICSRESLNALPAINSPEFRLAACDACRISTQFISSEFRQPSLQQRIIAAVKQDLCPYLPGDLSNQCLNTADQIVPMIMQHIADYVSGVNFCKEIGLCRVQGIPST